MKRRNAINFVSAILATVTLLFITISLTACGKTQAESYYLKGNKIYIKDEPIMRVYEGFAGSLINENERLVKFECKLNNVAGERIVNVSICFSIRDEFDNELFKIDFGSDAPLSIEKDKTKDLSISVTRQKTENPPAQFVFLNAYAEYAGY